VPVVPVAIEGSQGIRSWKRLVFPRVTIHYGEPISFPVVEEPTREQQVECATEIFGRVRELYEELARDGRSAVIKRVREGGDAHHPSYS
jgi:1-acyl-sn-glycerol-3-phosphate acyltransferase